VAAPATAGLADARALASVGQYQEALDLASGVGTLEAHLVEARCLRGLGQDAQARNVLRDALADADESDPSYPHALFALAEIHARLGRYRPAVHLVEEIRDLAPDWNASEVEDLLRGLKLMVTREPRG